MLATVRICIYVTKQWKIVSFTFICTYLLQHRFETHSCLNEKNTKLHIHVGISTE